MAESVRLIKKYSNRRLYDTKICDYVNLADLKNLVLRQEEFKVIDANSHEDLTRSILLQIMLEEELGGHPMFTCDVLTQLIRLHGNSMHGMMGSCLQRNVQVFNEVQKRVEEESQALYESKTSP